MKLKKTLITLLVLVILAAALIMNAVIVVPTGYTGVRITAGQVSSKVVENGVNFVIPFAQDIKKVNNKQQDITDGSRIWSETAERTAIYYEGVTVTYQINPDYSVWIYANVTNYENNLVSQDLIASAIKMSSKTLNDMDATNRGIIEPLIYENLQKSLNEKYQENAIILNKVTVSNIDFDDSYNEAIAAKQKAQIEAQQQAIENKKAIEKAEADASVKKTAAQAQADALLIQAEAEAKANELRQQSLTDEILRQMFIDKWDGQLPEYLGSENSSLLIDITGQNAAAAEKTE